MGGSIDLCIVSGVVQDPSGQPFAFGTWQLIFKENPNSPGPYTNISVGGSGLPITRIYNGSFDATGAFSQSSVVRNDVIAPGGSKYTFIAIPNASDSAYQVDIFVSGTAIDISSQINAIISNLQINAFPVAYAYKDSEIIPIPKSGALYYDVTLKQLKVWDAISGTWTPLVKGNNNIQIFSSTGASTFTIPVPNVKVTVVAAGGAGGGCNTASGIGSGGGSGSSAIKYLNGLTPGKTLNTLVGTGGAGNSNANGSNGGASQVTSGTQIITSILTNGGSGGFSGAANQPGGSSGPVGTGGDLNFAGNPGEIAVANAAGNGGGSIFCGGGSGGTSGGGTSQGTSPGAGGGGVAPNGSAPQSGSNGANGIIIFEWSA